MNKGSLAPGAYRYLYDWFGDAVESRIDELYRDTDAVLPSAMETVISDLFPHSSNMPALVVEAVLRYSEKYEYPWVMDSEQLPYVYRRADELQVRRHRVSLEAELQNQRESTLNLSRKLKELGQRITDVEARLDKSRFVK